MTSLQSLNQGRSTSAPRERERVAPPSVGAGSLTSAESGLSTHVLALGDEVFERALAAWERCERRRIHRELPEGQYDAHRCWQPCPSEVTDIVRQARAPNRTSPEAYRLACRSLEHCAALEGARYGDALLVKYWVRGIETMREPPSDVRAFRSALQLRQLLDPGPASLIPRRRSRL